MFWKILLRENFGGQGSGNYGHAGRPGEVGGSGEGVDSVGRAKELGKNIANSKQERGYTFDKNGSVIMTHVGKNDRISLSSEDRSKMNGNVFLHNHPSGGSFSPRDVAFAANNNLAEIHVVGQDKIYSMKPKPGGRFPTESEIGSGRSDSGYVHDFWKQNADRLGLIYEEHNL